MIEQEDEQMKSQNSSPTDNRKHDENTEYQDTDSESEDTNSESNNSNDETSHMLDEEDMDIEPAVHNYTEPDNATYERDINFNNKHIVTEVRNRTRPNAPRRKISRLTSDI